MCHMLTKEEARERFLKEVWNIVWCWEKRAPDKTQLERLEGVAFSILTLLDGDVGTHPGYLVIPNETPEDQQWRKDQGDDWYPLNVVSEDECDIGGGMHEHFFPLKPQAMFDAE